MRGFQNTKSALVTITHGGDVAQFRLDAHRYGTLEAWRAAASEEGAFADEHAGHLGMAHIALGLALGKQLDVPLGEPRDVKATIQRIIEELRAANLTEGDVAQLFKAVADLNMQTSNDVEAAAKNSGAPAAGGA